MTQHLLYGPGDEIVSLRQTFEFHRGAKYKKLI